MRTYRSGFGRRNEEMRSMSGAKPLIGAKRRMNLCSYGAGDAEIRRDPHHAMR